MEFFFLQPSATIAALEAYCRNAIAEKAAGIIVPPLMVKKAKEFLDGAAVNIAVPVGYPYGWNAVEAKLSEVILAMVDGADELDFYINLTALKNHDWQYLAKELTMAMTVIRKQQKKINIVFDAALLTDDELTKCCDLYGVAGADSLTVSTGLNEVAPEPVLQLLRQQLANAIPLRAIAIENNNLPAVIARPVRIVK
ncbi:MAG: 2-deoxyribose-5-phosphate aldolase [Ferruginibacter sp.]